MSHEGRKFNLLQIPDTDTVTLFAYKSLTSLLEGYNN